MCMWYKLGEPLNCMNSFLITEYLLIEADDSTLLIRKKSVKHNLQLAASTSHLHDLSPEGMFNIILQFIFDRLNRRFL
jgi:hypothetical protein